MELRFDRSVWLHPRTAIDRSDMLGFVLFAMVLAASAIIGGAFYWGFRNGTLSESEEERFDRRFDEIIATDVYVARLRRSES